MKKAKLISLLFMSVVAAKVLHLLQATCLQ